MKDILSNIKYEIEIKCWGATKIYYSIEIMNIVYGFMRNNISNNARNNIENNVGCNIINKSFSKQLEVAWGLL